MPLLAAAFAAIALATADADGAASQAVPAGASQLAALGRGIEDVELVDDEGGRVRWRDLKGRPRAVFFGFTRCPVICPVTIWEIDTALEKIGPGAAAVQINFVSLDPARDTPAAMRSYFSSFKRRMRALTGSKQAIGRVAKAFEIVHEKVALKRGDYTIDHTAAVFLLDETGTVVDILGHGTPRDVMVARFKKLLRIS